MNLNILITTYCNLATVRRCFESLMPTLPATGVRILIADTQPGPRGEVRPYVRRLASEDPRIRLFEDPPGADNHGPKVDFLVGQSRAEWILAMDSDVEIKRGDWLEVVRRVIEANPKMRVCGRTLCPFVSTQFGPRLVLARPESAFVLANREFVAGERLSFTGVYFEARAAWTKRVPDELAGAEEIEIWLDTAWQYFYGAVRRHAYLEMPPELAACWKHYWGGTQQKGGRVMQPGDIVEVEYGIAGNPIRRVRGKLVWFETAERPDMCLAEVSEIGADGSVGPARPSLRITASMIVSRGVVKRREEGVKREVQEKLFK